MGLMERIAGLMEAPWWHYVISFVLGAIIF